MQRSLRCQKAIDYAAHAVGRLGHPHVSSGHLVLGLLTLNGGVADTELKRAGLTTELVEQFLSSKHRASEQTLEEDGAPFGRSAADAIAKAESDAAASSYTILGVEQERR